MNITKTIAVDIDGTLRNFEKQVGKYLEIDHPDKIDKYREVVGTTYRTLDAVFPTKNEVYKWMYEERVFEIFGMAERIHKTVIDDLNIFHNVAKHCGFEVVIASVQRKQSVTATMHWLAKWGCKLQGYHFFDCMQDKIDADFDIYLDDSPQVLDSFLDEIIHPTMIEITPIQRAIKVPYKFTKDIDCPTLDIANGKFDDIYDILSIEKMLKR